MNAFKKSLDLYLNVFYFSIEPVQIEFKIKY
jgi:hypothetical protein